MIVSDFSPKTVLDAGCAWGYLVEALRDLGVEAYGIDASHFAINMVREDIRPFCAITDLSKDLPEHFPQRFDLVTSIEVLEHMREELSLESLKNLCRFGDKIIFSSSPDNVTEETHYNAQQIEYWSKKFVQHGFVRNLTYVPDYVASWAFLVEKEDKITVSNIVEDYERQLRISIHKLNQRTGELNECQSELEQHESELNNCQRILKQRTNEHRQSQTEFGSLYNDLNNYKSEYHLAIQQRDHYLAQYSVMQRSTLWRLTKPVRVISSGIKKILRTIPGVRLFYLGLVHLRHCGSKETFRKTRAYLSRKKKMDQVAHSYVISDTERKRQRKMRFSQDITFSILVPLFNTPIQYLNEMIESVLAQTYSNWELCLADGSDDQHTEVMHICTSYAQKDKRIKYKRLTENLGISGNTNKCIDMSTGDYIGLLDHDDLLHPSALFEVMSVIESQKADFIYTDEATIDGDVSKIKIIHFKPDFAIDYFRSVNYICHFTCFRRDMLDQCGGFRSEYDGSQDFDLFLRLIEKAKKIVHVPKLMYYWRAHPLSVASETADKVKPYAINAAKKAILNHLKRCGIEGEVDDSLMPTTYRVRYKLKGKPLISIVIPNKNETDTLRTCLNSIERLSTYENYEIVIVENNSTIPDIFSYYEELRSNNKIKVVEWDDSFNFSSICNYGVNYTSGDYLLFLNNDVEVISPDWLSEMLMFAQRDDIGAVGAKLYYPDDTVQHAGVILGLGGVAGHSHKYYPRSHAGYFMRLSTAQNFSSVTGACMMVPKKVFTEVGGFDDAYRIAFNDVDFCMRIRQKGYSIVFTPYAELYHYESKSRGYEDTPEKIRRFQGEMELFRSRWANELAAGDPYYNLNLTLEREDFSIKT